MIRTGLSACRQGPFTRLYYSRNLSQGLVDGKMRVQRNQYLHLALPQLLNAAFHSVHSIGHLSIQITKPSIQITKPLIHSVKPSIQITKPLIHSVKPSIQITKPLIHSVKPSIHSIEPSIHGIEPLAQSLNLVA